MQQAAEILGLTDYLARYPRQLSGGQRQRVAMGRAIVRDPQVFLFDEPLSNLDAKLRVQMRTEIRQLHQRLTTTTIYVTHDQIEAMTMADRIVVMNNGNVEQIGTPLDLYDRPTNVFVAGFIGSPGMNMLHGRISADAPAVFESEGGGRLPLPEGIDAGPDRRLIYGIRPEHLIIDPDGLPFTTEVVEPTGAEFHVLMRAAGDELTGSFRERITARPGETIAVRPDLPRIHLFDAASGQRLNTD